MDIINTKFKGLKIISHKRNSDSRGSLRETFNKKFIKWDDLVFDYATISKKNVLRGFHFQYRNQQVKYVSVIKGKILDCVVDLRKNSKTFGKSFSIILSEKNCKSLYIPRGFAHAYYSYENLNIMYYRLSDYYKPNCESGIIWNDEDLNISWPNKKPSISKKDKMWKDFKYFKSKFKCL
ncbi:MAG: dTDP-4-dehydrorhamnose 3,5-epimerase [Pelagibacterales bacterium]|nr:dTDP-4-dehydrorhamnose 3,5-epimerase [Pelagibacterales bacterium]